MDARSIAVQDAILRYLREKGAHILKDSERGNMIFVQIPLSKVGASVEISVREFATYVADRMKPE